MKMVYISVISHGSLRGTCEAGTAAITFFESGIASSLPLSCESKKQVLAMTKHF
ncbi:MAG: hypothetical protein WC331_04740 [Candidatus Omnitrophota bacterium]